MRGPAMAAARPMPSNYHQGFPTVARRETALVRLVERGPDGLARVKGGAYGAIAERRRSRP